jgi:uncharacterized membrane-anchored protein
VSRASIFGLTLGSQLAVLGFLVVREERVLRLGERVVLEIGPRDPMDLFRGRYLDTPVAIGRLDLTRLEPVALPPGPGERIYVRLEHGEPFWRPVGIASAIPTDRSAPYLEGRVESVSGTMMTVEYGLDRFYIPETAVDPSGLAPGSQTRPVLTLAVRVSSSGRGVIEDLLVDGKSFAEWSRAQPR